MQKKTIRIPQCSCKEKYFSISGQCFPCDDNCKECSNSPTNCTECPDIYQFNPYIPNTCYKPCSYKYYVDDTMNYQCLGENENCPENYSAMIIETNQCVKSCNDSIYDYSETKTLFQYMNNCVFQCPDDMVYNENNICVYQIKGVSQPNQTGNTIKYTTTIDKYNFTSDINNTINSIILNNKYSGNDTTQIIIESDDYLFRFYTSNETFDDETSSKIELGDCENTLRTVYQIPEEEEIFIAQIVFPSSKILTNTHQYAVYDSKGNELQLEVCDSIKVSSPIQDMDSINLELAKQLQEEGIDIFNPNEPIFNDKCIPFSIDGKDLTVKDRRNNILANVSLCESGCQVVNANYTSGIVNCECSPKTTGISSIIEESEMFQTLKDLFESYNLDLFLCYKTVLRNEKIYTNYTIWIMPFCLLSYLVLFFVFQICQLKIIYALTNKYSNNPPKLIHFESTRKSSLKSQDDAKYNISFPTLINQTSQENQNLTKEKDIKEEIGEFTSAQLNEMNYSEASEIDKRSIWKMYLEHIIEKQIILSTMLSKSFFYPLTLRLMMLIFTLFAFLFFNGLFFTDEYISKRYNSEEKINISYILNNELTKSLYASLIGLFIGKIMIIVTSINRNFMEFKKEKKSRTHSKLFIMLIKSYKKRVIIVFIIIIVLTLIFGYFLIIFCNIYTKSQMSWIQSSIVSIGINCMFPVILCIIIVIFRYCGIKYHKIILFQIGFYIYQFI